jgi:hypothetical protein
MGLRCKSPSDILSLLPLFKRELLANLSETTRNLQEHLLNPTLLIYLFLFSLLCLKFPITFNLLLCSVFFEKSKRYRCEFTTPSIAKRIY